MSKKLAIKPLHSMESVLIRANKNNVKGFLFIFVHKDGWFVDGNIIELKDRIFLLKGILEKHERELTLISENTLVKSNESNQEDSSACKDCGAIMVRTGTCYTCTQCGSTGGCG